MKNKDFPSGQWSEAVVSEVVQLADRLLGNEYEVMEKGRQDIVTTLDIQMEREIKALLLSRFPNDGFVGEEENQTATNHKRIWVCDPIDGTLNFTQGIPYFGVQLALLEGDAVLFSMIYLPKLKELYTAIFGQGAFLNGTSIATAQTQTLEKSIVTFGDFSKSNPSSRTFQNELIGRLLGKAMRIRIQGASSVDFAFVSSHKNAVHILFSKNIWEMAPGILLAKEAGCVVHKFSGANHGFEGEGLIISANQNILDEILTEIEKMKSL